MIQEKGRDVKRWKDKVHSIDQNDGHLYRLNRSKEKREKEQNVRLCRLLCLCLLLSDVNQVRKRFFCRIMR